MSMKVVRGYQSVAVGAPARAWPATQRLASFARYAWLPALGLLGWYVLFYVQYAGQLVAYPFGVDQGEGYDVWSAWLIRLGQLPYSSNDAFPYFSSNYPPLWSALASLPMQWLGPSIGAARVVSILSALIAAALIGRAAYNRTLGARPASAAFAGFLAAALFLASPYVFHTTPLARVNSTALMWSLIAITLLEVPRGRRVMMAGLALLAALYTKPTAIDATAASLIFLTLVQARMAPVLAATILVPGITIFGWLQSSTSGAFWTNGVIANLNPFDWPQLATYLFNFGMTHGVLILLAALEVARSVRARSWSPWVLYFMIAGALSITVGKWGAGESYFLGLVAATSVLAASAVARLVSRPGRPVRAAEAPLIHQGTATTTGVLGIALLLQLLIMAHGPLSESVDWLPDRGVQARALGRALTLGEWDTAATVAERIGRLPGQVLSEEPSFLLAVGKPVVGNATQLRNLTEAGLWNSSGLVEDLQARRYSLVVLNAQLYPEPVLTAIGGSYRLDQIVLVGGARYSLFLPRVN